MITDEALTALHVNDAWHALSNGTPTDRSWIDFFDPDERERIIAHLRTAVEGDREMTFEARGGAVYQWLEIRVAQAEPPASLVVVVLDVTAQRRREASLAFKASRDSLTGLYNRRALLEHMQLALARLQRRTSMIAVAFIDLDRFKEVNDRHGHKAGDHVLTSVAERLRDATRPSDILARVGGDEFVVLCEDLDEEPGARTLAHRLADALSEPIRLATEIDISLTASVGVAVTHSARTNPAILLDRADLAMYEARRRGISVLQAETMPRESPNGSVRAADLGRETLVRRLKQTAAELNGDRDASHRSG